MNNCKIEFKLIEGIILIKGKILNTSGYWAFDTGAALTIANINHFSNIEGKVGEVINYNNDMTTSTTKEIHIDKLYYGNLEVEDKTLLFFDMDYVEKELRKHEEDIVFLGSIGQDIISKNKVYIDYNKKEIIFDYNGDNFENYIDFTMEKVPVIKLNINNEIIPFVLDTGANACLLHNTLENNENLYHYINEEKCLNNVNFVNETFNEIKVSFSDLSDLREKVKVFGIVGYDVLKDKKVIFDFIDNRVYIK